MVHIHSTKAFCQENLGVDESVGVRVCVMCRSRKVVDNTLIDDLSKMQYKNTNKGAADERLTWS